MSSDAIREKAERLLVEGRIRVLRAYPSGLIVAKAEGDNATYDLGFDPRTGEWRCTCPARVPTCSHLLALQLVTAA